MRIFSILSALILTSSTLLANTTTIVDSDFDVGGTGAEVAASGDLYQIGHDMNITTTNSAVWNTTLATLEFDDNAFLGGTFPYGTVGAGTKHNLDYTSGQNLGKTYGGFTSNFAWDTLKVDWIIGNTARQSLLNMTSGALYTRTLVLGGGSSTAEAAAQIALFMGSGIIYYDPLIASNAYLLSGGVNGTYNFASGSSGQVIPIPEPGSVMFGVLAGAIAAGSGFSWCRKNRRQKAAR